MIDSNIPRGNDKRIEIEVSSECRANFKRMISAIDPEMSYEDMILLTLEVYKKNPEVFRSASDSDAYNWV